MHSRKNKLEDSPATNIESSIVALESFDYTDYIDNDYQYHFDQEGDSFMFKHSRPTLASVLLLSFILVLSACGTNGATENAASQQPKTKIVKTVNGEVEIPFIPKELLQVNISAA